MAGFELECMADFIGIRTDVDGATNLEQEIGAAPEPAHLLRFIHSTVHQEIGGPSVMAVPTSDDEVRALLERTHCLH